MKKNNAYNPIYDEILNEVANGIIKVGTNRDFTNYKFRMENIKNGNYTKDDIIALLICAEFGNKETESFIEDNIDKLVEKLENNEELEKNELKFLLETKEAINDSSIIWKERYSRSIYDIPESLRSKDVILNFMHCQNSFEYIKNHIEEYDCQFFKDLIETNFFLVNLEDQNIFSIMPLEYIDEEMCLLAVLKANEHGYWFSEVYKRKPEVLTERLWKIAARLYVFNVQDAIDLMRVTPQNYKDYEFYQELCSRGSYFFESKENVTDAIPSEILTPQFLLELIQKQSDNVSTFSESALNTELSYKKYQYCLSDDYVKEITITQKAWQKALIDNGENIWYVKPDDEKLKFFSCYYPEGTEEYKKYIVGEENINPEEKTQKSNSVTGDVFNEIGEILRESKNEIGRLPRKYIEEILDNEIKPGAFMFKIHDMFDIYEMIGIVFDENYDTVGPNNYLAILPEGWKIIELDSLKSKLKIDQFLKRRNERHFTLNNENGEIVLEFSRTFDGQNNNSLVEKINYEKVEEAYKKLSDSKGFNI